MQAEFTHLAIFVLVGVFVLLTCWRLLRATGRTIGQLRDESNRDRLQHKRIAAERDRQFVALRRGSRKINGKRRNVRWDAHDQRAHRAYHLDDAADEVFDDVLGVRGMDVRTPWGWPSSSGKRISPAGRRRQPAFGSRVRNSAKELFKSKRVIDEEYRAQQERSIRALVEDRYGRVSYSNPASDIEWSAPQLPPELVRERESARIIARMPKQDSEFGQKNAGSLRLVSDEKTSDVERRKAAGE